MLKKSFRISGSGTDWLTSVRKAVVIQNRLEQFENEKTTLDLQHQYYHYLKEYLESKNESGDIVSPSVMGVK